MQETDGFSTLGRLSWKEPETFGAGTLDLS